MVSCCIRGYAYTGHDLRVGMNMHNDEGTTWSYAGDSSEIRCHTGHDHITGMSEVNMRKGRQGDHTR